MYTLGIHFHIGRAHSAALLPEVVALIEAGRLQPEIVTTSVVDWEDAADAYLEPTIKLVVRRDLRVTTSALALRSPTLERHFRGVAQW